MTLQLRLEKRDLINLVRGTSPPYAVFNHPLVKPHFTYCDHPQHEEWRGLERLSEVELWALYMVVVTIKEES